jgi:NAD(P)-dependent dehydrogenase (short-subunit alcohol dehydrogenase family)
VLPIALDVTDTAQIASAVQTAEQHFGGIDVMFNNAGIGYFAAFEESDEAEARRLMEINLFGLAATTKAVLPGMRRRGSGTILNVTSIGGQRSFPAVSWYNASKFAVEGLSEPLAPGLTLGWTYADGSAITSKLVVRVRFSSPAPTRKVQSTRSTSKASGTPPTCNGGSIPDP